jgi:hypothetical protein
MGDAFERRCSNLYLLHLLSAASTKNDNDLLNFADAQRIATSFYQNCQYVHWTYTTIGHMLVLLTDQWGRNHMLELIIISLTIYCVVTAITM